MRRNKASPMFVFIFTIVTSEFVAYLAMLLFGTWPKTIFPQLFWPVTLVGEIAVSAWDVRRCSRRPARWRRCGASCVFATRPFMVAVADNPALAEFYGIDRQRVFTLTMLIAGAGRGRHVPLWNARPGSAADGLELMLFATLATIIGGIGNVWGAALAAIVLGVVQNASILVIPSEWQGFLLYVFLFATIIFLPQGFRLPERRKKLAQGDAMTAPAADKPASVG